MIDDEPSIRRLIGYALERSGYTCAMAADGEEGLRVVRDQRPRLVILDVTLPRLNGYDVCAQIRQDPNLSHTYVLMLSAKGQEIDRERGFLAGADAYLTKPFRLRELLNRVAAVLEAD